MHVETITGRLTKAVVFAPTEAPAFELSVNEAMAA